MLKYVGIAFLALIVVHPAVAADSKPTAESVTQLLDITNTRNLVDSATGQIESAMQAGLKDWFAGRQPTPDQQKILDDMRLKTASLFKEQMNWEKIQPTLIDLYQRSFTQEEVNGLISFYNSGPGKAVLAKMPAVNQNSTKAIQDLMTPIIPKLQQLQKDTAARLQALQPKG
jgi:hypothetical protein